MLKLLLLCFLLFSSDLYAAEKIIVPPKYILDFSTKLAYKDFPTQVDILAIIRVESGFNPNAFNPEHSKINPMRKVPPSIGLMQVQNGSFLPKENMRQGTSKLREYYIKYCKRNIECAVTSYNIGPTNYKNGKVLNSGKKYYNKFKQRKLEYELYISKSTHQGKFK